jgi:hypothetical protein
VLRPALDGSRGGRRWWCDYRQRRPEARDALAADAQTGLILGRTWPLASGAYFNIPLTCMRSRGDVNYRVGLFIRVPKRIEWPTGQLTLDLRSVEALAIGCQRIKDCGVH